MNYQRKINILAVIIGIEAILVMTGWVFNIDALTRIMPYGENMKFLTAVSFLIGAVGLYYMRRLVENNYEPARLILPGIAMALFLLMGTTFISYIAGGSTGLDSLFVLANSPEYSRGAGLPALSTMICFIFFGLSCMYGLFSDYDFQKRLKFYSYSIFTFGLVATVGYVVNLPILYFKFDSMTPMAINTALSFILLGYALSVISKIKTANEA